MWSVYIRRSTPQQKFSFQDLLDLQEQVLVSLRENLAAKTKPTSALLLVEMNPTVTLGARQVHDEKQVAAIDALREKLKLKNVDLVSGERGGKETWHGPGQWVGFVVTPLEEFTGDSKGIRKAVYKILENVLKVVREYDAEARIEEGDRLGIWSKLGKMVSVGIKIRSGYVTSGFALNCFPHELSFYGINPCGLDGAIPDFIFIDRVKREEWAKEFEKLPEKLVLAFAAKSV